MNWSTFSTPEKRQKFLRSFVTLLRLLVGWHFLYEGLAKAFANQWSAAGYLRSSH